MLRNIIFITLFVITSSFQITRTRNFIKTKLFSGDHPEDEVRPIDLDIAKIIMEFDKLRLDKLDEIPKAPEEESEIEEDSFEGYLRNHFSKLKKCDDKKISFKEFYRWRKNEIGTVLREDEIFDFYKLLVGDKNNIGLMSFISLNKTIDENDGAEY